MRASELVDRLAELAVVPRDAIDAQLQAARARWPAAPLDERFVAFVAERLADPVRIEDLYFAWWCSLGDAAAVAAFEVEFADDLRAATSRFRELPADELRQLLRIKLFVGAPPETPPKIRDYAGSGSLRGWVRVTATRTFIDQARAGRARRNEQELDDTPLLGLVDGEGPEGTALRAELRGVVARAFTDAVAQLEPRERVFLRHAYVDGHTLDQIAAHYALHRTTVARTLAAARERLATETRARVAAAAGVDPDDLASVIRWLDTQLELSLSRVLARRGHR